VATPWDHPYLWQKPNKNSPYNKAQLETFAYDYFLKFLPFFRNQPEGSMGSGTTIKFTRKMKHKLGLANLFFREIRINQTYFAADPKLLPYTLFHEMVHLWLYDCGLDPGHTRRFYLKMQDFQRTGLPLDPDVHIHSRIAQEAKFVYVCPSCQNRWFLNEKRTNRLTCGPCYELKGIHAVPERFVNAPKL
jgi:predicted SprT family Zn-dependent metalloprotease